MASNTAHFFNDVLEQVQPPERVDGRKQGKPET
jgi:hypothetical protein